MYAAGSERVHVSQAMETWQWECFEDLVKNDVVEIVEPGPLRVPIRSFTLKRNRKLQIVLATIAEPNATTQAPVFSPGTVRVSDEKVGFSGTMGISAVATGVEPYRWSMHLRNDVSQYESREEASVHKLEGTIGNSKELIHCIDWLGNVNDIFLWPNLTDEETEITRTLVLHGGAVSPI